MAIDLNSITRGASHLPPRILVYGVQGIGKTTLGARAPNPIFIQTEDGLGVLDVDCFPVAKSFQDVIDALVVLATEDHNFKTLVVDSLDWLEPLVWRKTAADNGKSSIEEFGYGRGFTIALDVWAEYLDAINYLRNKKGMTIIQVAHADVKRYDDPQNEPYDRYQIKLHKGASAKVQEHSDVVLFANYRVSTVSSEIGMNKKKARAVGSGDRLLYTEERPAFLAKNRYDMPPEILFNKETCWSDLAKHIPFFNQNKGDK